MSDDPQQEAPKPWGQPSSIPPWDSPETVVAPPRRERSLGFLKNGPFWLLATVLLYALGIFMLSDEADRFGGPNSFGLGWALIGLGVVATLLALVFDPGHSPDRWTAPLAAASQNWTAPVIVRSFDNTEPGHQRLEQEAQILQSHGYHIAGQSSESGRFRAGAALAGGLAGLAATGGTHSKGKITLTFSRGPSL